MRFAVPAPVAAACVAGPAARGEAPSSPVREEVTVSRVQVEAVVLPRGSDPRSCRELLPGNLVARVGGREWRVEAIDWEGAGEREDRRVRAGEVCLQVAVYLGRYVPWLPLDCPWDPHVREDTPPEPPGGDLHPRYDADVALAARRMLEQLRPCDRVALFRSGAGKMDSTRLVESRERALALPDALVGPGEPRGDLAADILVRPTKEGGWEGIVASLGAVPGHKDLFVVGGNDFVHVAGDDPWRIAHLAEESRRARVTIHRVDPVTEGRVDVPDGGAAGATGGARLPRGRNRARVLEEVRRQAYCRARVTLVPPPGTPRERSRAVSLSSRDGPRLKGDSDEKRKIRVLVPELDVASEPGDEEIPFQGRGETPRKGGNQ